MPRLTDISIRMRIAMACLLPMAAFTVFAGKVLIEQQSVYSKTKEIAIIAEEAPRLKNLKSQI